jgi:hypothetical protein
VRLMGLTNMKVELDKFLPFRRSGSKADLALNSLRFDGIEQTWDQIPRLFRALVAPLPPRWEEIFGPLREGKIDDLMGCWPDRPIARRQSGNRYRPLSLHQLPRRARTSSSAASPG